MNVDSSNGYPLSSDDDVDPNDSVDDNGSFFDELVDEDDDGSYIEEEAEYDEEGSAEPNNNDVLDDENEEDRINLKSVDVNPIPSQRQRGVIENALGLICMKILRSSSCLSYQKRFIAYNYLFGYLLKCHWHYLYNCYILCSFETVQALAPGTVTLANVLRNMD